MLKKTITFACVGLSMAACNLTGGDISESRFATPSSSGTFSEPGRDILRDSGLRSSTTNNLVAYNITGADFEGFRATAGIASGASVTAPQDGGNATLSGRFDLVTMQSITESGDRISGVSFGDFGNLTLVADFVDDTLTGSSTGFDAGSLNTRLRNNPISVDGTISGTTLSGTVTYNGVTGPLQGLVGGNEAIGAFHGNSDSQIHAGGFIVN